MSSTGELMVDPHLVWFLGALWLLLAGAVLVDVLTRPRCPRCGSKRTVCQGELNNVLPVFPRNDVVNNGPGYAELNAEFSG